VVLIDKQPPHHTGYIEKLTKFAELSTKNSGTGEKPFLIIIQNFANPDNQKDGTASYTLRQSTSDFMQCLSQQKKTQELLQHYREICFIRLPSWTSERLLFDQQICLLQVSILFVFFLFCLLLLSSSLSSLSSSSSSSSSSLILLFIFDSE
jgi:hypothetical protein